jgi:WD40 repeat protein
MSVTKMPPEILVSSSKLMALSPVGAIQPSGQLSNDQHPAISPDGLSLYFASDRPGSVVGSLPGTLDLWVSQQLTKDSAWACGVSDSLGQ